MLEWRLNFIVEPGESELRFRHILHTFQADAAVERVEVSNDITEPGSQSLIVFFKEGQERPENRRLHHCDKVYGTAPVTRRSRYQRLLDDEIFDE